MSCTKRTYSPEFKAKLVLEVLKGEKELNVIATENDIQPNLLRNWKKEFLDKASVVFDDSREENLKEKLASERKEKDQYAKKVGQLTMQVDWLKKSLKKCLDLTKRVNLARSLSKTDKKEISAEELICKRIFDQIHTENLFWGARQMSAPLKLRGYHIGRKKARRYMNEMVIDPIYTKMNLSKRQK